MSGITNLRGPMCGLISGLLIIIAIPASAACNNPRNWFEAPSADIKVFAGYRQEPQNDLAGEPSWSDDKPFPIPLPTEMLHKGGMGQLSKQKTSSVSYYEPDGKGHWRVCRVEDWAPADVGSEADRKKFRQVTLRYSAGNPVLADLASGHVALFATLYYYDVKGRIESVSKGRFEDPDLPAIYLSCRSYDNQDRVSLWVRPTTTNICPKDTPDQRDTWTRFRYGGIDGQTVALLNQMHTGKADGSWEETIQPFRLFSSWDAPWGNAEIDSVRGVTSIIGSNLGKRDDNAANTVVNELGRWSGSTYYFTEAPVPPAVLEQPDLIYKYARRRQTYVDGQVIKLFEFFKPNENIARHRYYMLDNYVLRHEQLDAKGRVTRVITIEDYRQPRPGPKPDVNDELLVKHSLVSLTHQVYHRVYDIDAKGKPTLVAVSWNRDMRLPPFRKVSIDLAHLVYGTPAGKQIWKTEAEFEKAFNTSSHAAQVFPEDSVAKSR